MFKKLVERCLFERDTLSFEGKRVYVDAPYYEIDTGKHEWASVYKPLQGTGELIGYDKDQEQKVSPKVIVLMDQDVEIPSFVRRTIPWASYNTDYVRVDLESVTKLTKDTKTGQYESKTKK